jgi:hypothetical protein
MNLHSPGPWSVCNNGECSCKQVWCRDYPIASVTHGKWGDTYPAIRIVGDSSLEQKAEPYIEMIDYGEVDEATAKANSLLIAAAPTMLAVLKGLAQDPNNAGAPAMNEILAAITLAEKGRPKNETHGSGEEDPLRRIDALQEGLRPVENVHAGTKEGSGVFVLP